MKTKSKNITKKSPSYTNAESALSLDQRLAYSIKEASKLIGISSASLYRLCERGVIRTTSSLRRKVIAKDELQRFLRNAQ